MAQIGNKNASKGKPWEGAIRRALARAEGTIDKGLDRVADKLVAAAIEGDPGARAEIGNRLDGKPTEHVQVEQEVTVTLEPVSRIEDKLRDSLAKHAASPVQLNS